MFVESLLPVAHGRLTTVQADASLTDTAKLLCGTHNALVVVCNADGAMVGVVTKTDVVRQISRCPGNVCGTTAAAVMTQEVVSCRPSDPLRGVLSLMKERGLKSAASCTFPSSMEMPSRVVSSTPAMPSGPSWAKSKTSNPSFAITSWVSDTGDRRSTASVSSVLSYRSGPPTPTSAPDAARRAARHGPRPAERHAWRGRRAISFGAFRSAGARAKRGGRTLVHGS